MTFETFELPLRRNLLLCVKEALNNAVKHSQASKLLLKIRCQNKQLMVTVADNGRGFDPAAANAERNGLTNLTQRMSEVGGVFHLTSAPGQGCRVEFATYPFPPAFFLVPFVFPDPPGPQRKN
jgi:signal transduction histidine kinase